MIDQILDFCAILGRQTIARGVRNVDHRCASLDDGLHHSGQIFVLGAAGVFGIEFHIVHKPARILDRLHRTLDYLLAIGIELILYVRVGRADAGVYPLVFGILESIHGYVNILFHGTGQRADCRPGHGLRDLYHRIEITRTRNGKTGFDYVNAQGF